jgi:hypothetical protein
MKTETILELEKAQLELIQLNAKKEILLSVFGAGTFVLLSFLFLL